MNSPRKKLRNAVLFILLLASASGAQQPIARVADADGETDAGNDLAAFEGIFSDVCISRDRESLYAYSNETYFQPRDATLYKFTDEGMLDRRFGEGGALHVDANVIGMAEFSDGSLLIHTYALSKVDRDGRADTRFKLDPSIESEGKPGRYRVRETMFACDDQALVSVFDHARRPEEPSSWNLIRLNHDGSLDPSFKFSSAALDARAKRDYPACKYVDIRQGESNKSRLYLLIRIIETGGVIANYVLFRFAKDGAIDATFLPIELGRHGYYPKILFKADGRLVIWNRMAYPQTIAEFMPDGSPNSRFAPIDLAALMEDGASPAKGCLDVILNSRDEILLLGGRSYAVRERDGAYETVETSVDALSGCTDIAGIDIYRAIDESNAFIQYQKTDESFAQKIIAIK